MIKIDLIEKISKETEIDKIRVAKVIDAFMVNIKESLAQNEDVNLRGFGTFTVKHRAEKVGRNIRANKPVIIPARKVPVFKPSKELVV